MAQIRLLALLTLLATALLAAPASATVTNLIATNQAGEPLDDAGITTVTTMDQLWAYVTTTTGTTLCVRVAPVSPNATCEDQGSWGGGVASTFYAGYVPVAGPALREGTYQLIAQSQFGVFGLGQQEAVSQPFDITPCDGACQSAGPPDPTAAKRVFRAVHDAMKATCHGAKVLSFLKKSTEVYRAGQWMVAAWSGGAGTAVGTTLVNVGYSVGKSMTIGAVQPKAVPYLPTVVGAGMWAMCKSFFGTTFPSSPIPFTTGPGYAIPGPLAGITRWLNDPPKPYEEITRPDPMDWSRFDLSELDPQGMALAKEVDALRAEIDAGTTAYERYQGAVLDGATTWVGRQASVTGTIFESLAQTVTDAARETQRAAAAMRADTAPDDTITQGDIDAADPVLRRVRDEGFTADEQAQLDAAGLDAQEAEDLRQLVGGDTEGVRPGRFSDQLDALARALHDARVELDAFGRQAHAAAISANQPPVASFTISTTSGTAPVVFSVTDTSKSPDGDPLQVRWDFGDGTTKAGTPGGSLFHRYDAPGTYAVRLTASDGLATSTATRTVTVAARPPGVQLQQTWQRIPVGVTRKVPLRISLGSGGPVRLVLEPGDGTRIVREGLGADQVIQELPHAWKAAGTYEVTATVTDADGLTGTASADVTVADAVADAGPDVAADEGQRVLLGGDGTSEPDSFTRFRWAFGDGAVASPGSPRQEHAYADDGTYTARLTVDDDGPDATDTAQVTVRNVAPTVGIAAPGQAQPGTPVALRALARDPGVRDVLTYAWAFGDGTSATGPAVQHTFRTPGTYEASVVVDDGDGGRTTRTTTIHVGPVPGVRDTRGRDFWLAFPDNHGRTAALTLFLAAERATTGVVEVPGLLWHKPFTVAPGTTTTVVLPPEAQLGLRPARQDLGVHVTAADEVTAYGLSHMTHSSDGFVGLPTDALGRRYRLLSYTPFERPVAAVVATDGTTRVTVTPPAGVEVNDGTPGAALTAVLDVGEVLAVQSSRDLTGALVEADRPVAVMGAHQCANVPLAKGACDHLVEQLPPVETWGRRFVTMPLATRVGGDRFRVVAAEDDTRVSIGGTPVATLAAGAFHEQVVDGPAAIEADKPVLLAQYAQGSSVDGVAADPFMAVVPPTEQFQDSATITTPAEGFTKHFVNLVVPAAAAGAVRLDGALLPEAGFQPIGTSGFVGRAVPLPPGDHRLESPLAFGALVYGFAPADSYGYGSGFRLAPIAVATLSLTPLEQAADVGTQACVTARARSFGGAAVPGVRVDLTRTGRHPGTTSITTGADGDARWCWTGEGAGADAVAAAAGSVKAPPATVTWRAPSPELVAPEPERPAPVVTPDAAPKAAVEPAPAVQDAGDVAPSTAASPTPNLVLTCARRPLVLEDVVAVRGRVHLTGLADRALAGRPVELVLAATKAVVARTTIGADGRFTAVAPLPPAAIRDTDGARYLARSGKEASLNLKLARRLLVERVRAAAGRVTITGRVVAPLAPRRQDRAVVVQRLLTCTRSQDVTTIVPRPDGRFSVTVPAGGTSGAAVFRLRTKVRTSRRSSKLADTFGLPRSVVLGG